MKIRNNRAPKMEIVTNVYHSGRSYMIIKLDVTTDLPTRKLTEINV